MFHHEGQELAVDHLSVAEDGLMLMRKLCGEGEHHFDGSCEQMVDSWDWETIAIRILKACVCVCVLEREARVECGLMIPGKWKMVVLYRVGVC